MIKLFPYDYEAGKEIQFYPDKPEVFDADVLEIGPGRGDLLMELATTQPKKKFVAVEIGKKRFYRLIPRLEKKEITNILLIRGDARVVVPRFFSEGTFERIFVLYPDPWPKDRHSFRRLLNTEMISLLSHHLKRDGDLVFASDVKIYADWVLENAAHVTSLKRLEVKPGTLFPLLATHPTYFEDKWVAAGKEMHYLWFVKR